MSARVWFRGVTALVRRRSGPRMRLRKLSRQGLAVALLLPAGVLGAGAGSRIEKTFRTTPNPRISISNPPGGSVVVRAWDKSEIHAIYTTTSQKAEIDVDQMPASGEAEKVHFATHVLDAQAAPQDKTASYELDVPAGATVNIENPAGSVSLGRLSGDAWVESVNGKISLDDCSGHVSARTLNGDIECVRLSGPVEVTSVMGNLRFSASSSPMVRAQTQSGQINFDGDFVPAGDYILASYQGAMDIACSPSDSFELRARTVRGKVDNQLRLDRRNHVPFSYGTGLFGNHNRGDATVELKSYSGTIHIRPRS